MSQEFNCKILVVEDDQEMRDIVLEALEPYFGQIIFAVNGKEAYELIKKHNPTLIVSDIDMPEMNGIEMMQLLRSEGNLTPVIFQTASNLQKDILAALRLGASDFIQKPYSPKELLGTIGRVMYSEEKKIELEELIAMGLKGADLERVQKTLGLIKAASIKN